MLFSAGSSQLLHIRKWFLCFYLRQNKFKILWKFQIFSRSIYGENKKNLLSELCEKENLLINVSCHLILFEIDLSYTLPFIHHVVSLI